MSEEKNVARIHDEPAIKAKSKTIENLDRLIVRFDGQVMKDDTNNNMTVKRAILLALAAHKVSAVESLSISKLCFELLAAKDEITVSLEDYARMKDALEKNHANLGALALGQTFEIFQS